MTARETWQIKQLPSGAWYVKGEPRLFGSWFEAYMWLVR